MYQFHFIWIAKAVIFIIGVIVIFIGISLLSKSKFRDNYEIELGYAKFFIKLKAGSLGIIVMFLGGFLIVSPFIFTLEYREKKNHVEWEKREFTPKPNTEKLLVPSPEEALQSGIKNKKKEAKKNEP